MKDYMMKTDLRGKVKNLKPFKSEALLPLFEAVANSIDAIEERAEKSGGEFKLSDGKIIIRILRFQQTFSVEGDTETEKTYIDGFLIEDNGIGFDDANYESFRTSDSTYKIEKGGKGVGRFFWLKAFDRVEIESVYRKGEEKYLRKIKFNLDGGIEEIDNSATDREQKTIVKLIGFKKEYRDLPTAYKKGATIARRILEHCLSYFIYGMPIDIVVYGETKQYSLNEMFEDLKEKMTQEKFEKNGYEFLVIHLKLYSTYLKMHKMFLTANRREVMSFEMVKPDMLGTKSQFQDEDGKFVYSVYVSSPYLDDNVDSSRLEFNIPENPNTLDRSEFPVCIEEIKKEVLERSKEFLKDYMEDLKKKKEENVYRFISTNNPSLRSVPIYSPEVYDEIDVDSTDEKINEVLYKHKGKAEYKIKEKSAELLKTQVDSISEIEEEYEKIVNQLEDFQKDDLASYIIFRKMIIDLLDKKIQLKEDGKYPDEKIIHDIIMPRKTSTQDISPGDHNLWLIDERLTFHELAYSDKALKDISSSTSKERPDIVVFSEIDDDRIAKAVSIIELKKPQRESYQDSNPTKQVLDYLRKIRDSKIKCPNGRPLQVNETTRFYCYVICDIGEEIKRFAEDGNYATLKGERGYYLYNRALNAHIEIISYDKILSDVKQRHRAFFEKLGVDFR